MVAMNFKTFGHISFSRVGNTENLNKQEIEETKEENENICNQMTNMTTCFGLSAIH